MGLKNVSVTVIKLFTLNVRVVFWFRPNLLFTRFVYEITERTVRFFLVATTDGVHVKSTVTDDATKERKIV